MAFARFEYTITVEQLEQASGSYTHVARIASFMLHAADDSRTPLVAPVSERMGASATEAEARLLAALRQWLALRNAAAERLT